MKRILALTAIVAVALLGTSCKSSSGDIFPMSVGSAWHMDILLMGGATTASLDTVQTGTATNTAVEKVTLTNGKDVVRFRTDGAITIRRPDPLSDTTIISTNYAYYREDGDWILGYSAIDDSTADTVMVTSPTVGKTWTSGTNATATVVGQEDVTVKAGTYKNAWKLQVTYTTDSDITEMYYWYAKGVGLVKFHYGFTIQGYTQDYTQELTSSDVK